MPALQGRSKMVFRPIQQLRLSAGLGFAMIIPLRNFGTTTKVKPTEARCTRSLFRHPSPAATRESPYPIVFLRTEGLGQGFGLKESDKGEWVDWASMFAEKGYTSIEIDISIPESFNSSSSTSTTATTTTTIENSNSSTSPIKAMTSSLASQIRLLAIPFPPVLVASESSTLLAQAYIEDHPASGLILIHPPGDDDPRSSSSSSSSTVIQKEGEGKWSWPKFGYEPHFPLLILSTQDGLSNLSTSSRLMKQMSTNPEDKHGGGAKLRGFFAGFAGGGRNSKGVDIGVLDQGELNESGRLEVERWMDREGF